LSAATVDNSVFVFGGEYFEGFYGRFSTTSYDEIFLYNPVTDSWTMAGRMSTPRTGHAVTVLSNIGNICRSGVTSPSPSPALAPAPAPVGPM